MPIKKEYFLYLIGGIILINAPALFSEIMEPDGALYAHIAKLMALHNDWINLYTDGTDWLDKPHFPFWITALSFKLLGISAFSYKLPAFIFWLVGIRFVYAFTKRLYNIATAQLAVIIYITALHGAIALFDVRAEHYLTTLCIGSMYYLYKLYSNPKLKYILAAAALTACAIMTKGIFILVTIVGGFALLWIITKQWRQFLRYQWWLFLLFSFVFIAPELYALYVQFDLHPEKIVFGQNHVSGIRFFFWDSQFGRFFNNGPIKGKGDVSFFLHTTIWAFLPWSIILYTAVISLFRKPKKGYNTHQWIIWGSALVTFLLFSLSKFQLPHYIIILFPQFAIISAHYLIKNEYNKKVVKSFLIIQTIVFCITAAGIVALTIWYELPRTIYIVVDIIISALIIYLFSYKAKRFFIIGTGIGFSLLLYPYLNIDFYPNLLQYQSGMVAAKWLNHNVSADTIGIYGTNSQTLKFYAHAYSKLLNSIQEVSIFNEHKGKYIYTDTASLNDFVHAGLSYTIVQHYEHFPVSRLNAKFIDHRTRSKEISTAVLIELQSANSKHLEEK